MGTASASHLRKRGSHARDGYLLRATEISDYPKSHSAPHLPPQKHIYSKIFKAQNRIIKQCLLYARHYINCFT